MLNHRFTDFAIEREDLSNFKQAGHTHTVADTVKLKPTHKNKRQTAKYSISQDEEILHSSKDHYPYNPVSICRKTKSKGTLKYAFLLSGWSQGFSNFF